MVCGCGKLKEGECPFQLHLHLSIFKANAIVRVLNPISTMTRIAMLEESPGLGGY
jgi:hypothetical protein